jgi:hypothetical protein
MAANIIITMKNKEPSESKYQICVTRLSVLPIGEPIYSDKCTHVIIVDEGAGEFIEVSQASDRSGVESQTIRIDTDEWPSIKLAVDQLISECIS